MNINTYIDHTLLRPDTDKLQISQLCKEAAAHEFAAVCIPPYFVRQAVGLLEDTTVKVATVIGFPMGYTPTVAKVEAIKRAIQEGATEIDMVINLAALKSGDWAMVKNDIDSCTRASHLKGILIKVIVEAGQLSADETDRICTICTELGVDYVKTSTGFGGPGASTEMIANLRSKLPATVRIKASGGIRTFEQAQDLIKAGADRLGTSAGVQILELFKNEKGDV